MSSSTSSSPIHALFVTEGLMKLAGGLIFIGSPRTILGLAMTPAPAAGPRSAAFPPAALLLTRMLGTQTLTLGAAMLLAAPAGRAARRVVSWTVLVRDAALLAVLGAQLLLPGAARDAPGALSTPGLRSWILEITPFFLGHLWLLLRRPAWF